MIVAQGRTHTHLNGGGPTATLGPAFKTRTKSWSPPLKPMWTSKNFDFVHEILSTCLGLSHSNKNSTSATIVATCGPLRSVEKERRSQKGLPIYN